jgi:hypothetical protein
VLCVRRIDLERDFEVVSDKECSAPKPKTKAKCGDEKCSVHWTTEPWTEVNIRCYANGYNGVETSLQLDVQT